MPAEPPVSWEGKKKKKKEPLLLFLGPTDMKSHQDINEDFINLHGCPVSAEPFVFGDICSLSVGGGVGPGT